MKAGFYALFVFLFVFASACAKKFPQELEGKVDPKALLNVATYDDGDQFKGYGSGFFVSADGYLLTAHHVIENGARFLVSPDGLDFKETKIVCDKPVLDLAVLKAEKNSSYAYVAIPLNNAAPAEGSKIYVFRRDNSGELGYYEGKLISGSPQYISDEGIFVLVYEISVGVKPGTSGGLVASQKGEALGEAIASYPDTAFFVPLGWSDIINFCPKLKN